MEENASSIHKFNLLHQISLCLLPVFQYPTYTAFEETLKAFTGYDQPENRQPGNVTKPFVFTIS